MRGKNYNRQRGRIICGHFTMTLERCVNHRKKLIAQDAVTVLKLKSHTINCKLLWIDTVIYLLTTSRIIYRRLMNL